MLHNQSETIEKLVMALSKVQGVIEGAKEDCSNPYFKSQYADLTSIWKACRQPLATNELAVIQTVDTREDKMVLVTTLAHSSGQWVKSFLPIIATKMDPQTVGSAITYARRYALAAIVGVAPAGEDDDAEKAMHSARQDEIKESPKASLSDKQSSFLEGLLTKDPDAAPIIKKQLSLESVYDMNPKDFDRIIKWLQQRKEAKNVSPNVA